MSGFTLLVPGTYYIITGSSGTLTTVSEALADTTDSTIQVKVVLKALTATMGVVYDWPAAPVDQPTF